MPGASASSIGGVTHAASLMRLVRLLQLASPALPIGGYSYSQGLEWAVAEGTIRNAADAQRWIGDMLAIVMARGEAPLAWRLLRTAGNDWPAFIDWNAWYRASRETAELAAETMQMGGSLVKLARDLDLLDTAVSERLPELHPITLPAAFALTARGFGVAADAALAGFIWSWLENQVLAAVKLVPLGQVAGQRMLWALGAMIPATITAAAALGDDDIATFAPGLALASSRHETQYSRLFRS